MSRIVKEKTHILPFTLVVDTREQAPYHFTGIRVDGHPSGCWIVPLEHKALKSGDYSISGMENSISCERKSKSDLYSTLGQRRDEFQAEIKRLHETCRIAHVIVECSRRELLMSPPPSSLLNPKTVNRTIISWGDRYHGVHWHFCDSRREAELECFYRLFTHWKHAQEASETETSTTE